MKKLLVTIALGAGVISAPALAQQGAERGGWMQRDQTRAEAQQRADMMFQMLDSNKDGVVTKAEAEQALAKFQAERGGDASNGGAARGAGRMQRMIDQAFGTAQSLTRQQFEALALARFDAQDADHNGTVTAAERQQQAPAATAGQAAPAAAPGKPQ